MAGKGPYDEMQKQYVKDAVTGARDRGQEPNHVAIAEGYNNAFHPKREPYEIAALIRLLFPTGRRGGPPAAEPKRRGRPPKVELTPDKARKRRETPKPTAKKGRVLTEAFEEAIVKLSGECVEVSRRINVGRLEGKIIAGFPELKGRVGYNLLRGVLRRHGAIEAVARGEQPEMAAKMPEDIKGRIQAELGRTHKRLIIICDERERLLHEGNRLNREAEALTECLQVLRAAGIGGEGVSVSTTTADAPSSGDTRVGLSGEAAASLAAVLASDPGPDCIP